MDLSKSSSVLLWGLFETTCQITLLLTSISTRTAITAIRHRQIPLSEQDIRLRKKCASTRCEELYAIRSTHGKGLPCPGGVLGSVNQALSRYDERLLRVQTRIEMM